MPTHIYKRVFLRRKATAEEGRIRECGGTSDGGVSCWFLWLVETGIVMLVQSCAEAPAPGLPNEGHDPTGRGSVARLV